MLIKKLLTLCLMHSLITHNSARSKKTKNNETLIYIDNPVEAGMPGHWVPLGVVKAILQETETAVKPSHPKPPTQNEEEKVEESEETNTTNKPCEKEDESSCEDETNTTNKPCEKEDESSCEDETSVEVATEIDETTSSSSSTKVGIIYEEY